MSREFVVRFFFFWLGGDYGKLWEGMIVFSFCPGDCRGGGLSRWGIVVEVPVDGSVSISGICNVFST